jgi:beta-lactamase regulating signal transducer with metallopeptidase domain
MNDFVDIVLSPLVYFMADWSLRWFAVTALPVLWLVARPPRDPRTRHLICLVTLTAGLAVPLVPRWGGLIPARPLPVQKHAETVAIDTPGQAPTVETSWTQNPTPVTTVDVVTPAAPVVSADVPVSENLDRLPVLKRGMVAATAVSWLAGILLLLARWIGGSVFLRRLRCMATTADVKTSELFAECRREMQMNRVVRLAFHADVRSPLVVGPWRSTILLPFSWRGLSPAMQRACLLHELAHLRRRDDWIALALRIADLVFFFHPVFRWFCRRVEREREMCCDDLVLDFGLEPTCYAQMLRDFASQPGRMYGAMAIPFGRRSTVKSRIQHILEEKMVHSRSLSRWSWLAGSALFATCLIAGGLRLFAAGGTPPDTRPSAENAPSDPSDQLTETAIPKEKLVFGGKTFDQWKTVWRMDLKPEVRIEAFQALATFARHGYAAEAAPAIIELASTYDPTTTDWRDERVYKSALEEIYRLGRPALPALESELKQGTLNGRRFSAIVLKQWKKDAKPAEKGLLEALNDADVLVRQQAALSLEYFAPSSDPKRLSLLMEVLEAPIPLSGPIYLSGIGEDLTAALQDLNRKGREARPIVGRLVKLIGKWGRPLGQNLVETIVAIGGEPNEIAPFVSYLTSGYKEMAPSQKLECVDKLISMGADPKDVVPLVNDLLLELNGIASSAVPFNPILEQRPKLEAYLRKHPVQSPAPNPAKPPIDGKPQTLWSPVGKLSRTAVVSDGAKVYRLVTSENIPGVIYCKCGPGVDLESHVNQRVKLFGSFYYHRSFHQYFMDVQQIEGAAKADQAKKPSS